ncbi:MAG TPA: spermidine/putrescine ABC transporter substrate-binding protein, partial [Gemmatimonadota bacterium]|nr:spermidine/putrescine ABC transporter substrate-binding protein [Gemmatimonadota bacterium]
MNRLREIERLAEALESGELGRREFLRRALAAGLGVATASLLVQACGGGTDDSSSEEAGRSATVPDAIEDRLAIYNWSDYVAPDTIPDFENEYGIEVTYDTYESNEEMLARLQAGASGYDVVFPTGYIIEAMLAGGLLAPIRRDLLTNWDNLSPIFLDPPFDPGNAHSVPYLWGMTGVAWRTDRLDTPPDSWGVFLDSRWDGKMTMLDDSRDVIAAFLKLNGYSLNSIVPEELEAAKRDAVEAARHIRAFVSAPVKGQLISGDVWIAQLWDGDTRQAASEETAIAFALPREGSAIYADAMVVPMSAPHKRAAHVFMDYMLRPEVGAAVSDATGYGTANAAAKPRDPKPYPSTEELARLEFSRDLGEGTRLWDRVWTEIKSA